MTEEIMAKIKAAIEGKATKAELKAIADEAEVAYTSKTTVAQFIEAFQEIIGDGFTTKDHGKNHGISYYIDGIRMFVIKTRKNGQAIVLFTKKSKVTGEASKDTRYVCEYTGAYNEVLEQAKKAVIKAQEAPEEEAEEEAPEELEIQAEVTEA